MNNKDLKHAYECCLKTMKGNNLEFNACSTCCFKNKKNCFKTLITALFEAKRDALEDFIYYLEQHHDIILRDYTDVEDVAYCIDVKYLAKHLDDFLEEYKDEY